MKTLRERIPVCPHRTKDSIDISLILALERLESEMKIELSFSSGVRCIECNTLAGGAKDSAHMRGLAVDIRNVGSGDRFWLIYNAIRLNFCRIGIGKSIVHLDVDTRLPQHVIWLY